MKSFLASLSFLGVCGLLISFPLVAAPAEIPTIPRGELIVDPAGSTTEAFELPAELATALRQAAIGGSLTLEGFPSAPGARQRFIVQRVDVYAQGAEILATDGRRQWSLPRTHRLHFLGTSPDDPRLVIGFSLDPENSNLRGLVRGPEGWFELDQDAGDPGRLLMQNPESALAGVEGFLEASCASEDLALPDDFFAHMPDVFSRQLQAVPRAAAGPTYEAAIAVDTDNEFNHLKFGNDTTAATDWLADLFTTMNVMYERDLALRLLQGTTILRLDTDPSPTYNDDPWTQSGTSASSAHLSEFGSYWQSNLGHIERVMAMLLSGKSSSSFSSSGIAWVDGYCEQQNTGGGYSVTMVFKANISVTSDIRVIGHELGHNFGSPHTHCYVPPVDECSTFGSGCYNGSNGLNCPPSGKGTLMSYCHFSNQANCGSNLLEFHPTVVSRLNGLILAHTPACIQEIVAGFFEDDFESGTTNAWSTLVEP